MKKKIGIFISLFVIVVMLVILIFNLFYKKNDNNNENENDNDIVTIKKLDINSDLVQELYSLVNPSNDARILKELYGNSNLTDSYILSMGMTNYIREHSQDEDFQLSKENIEKSIYQILGYSVNDFPTDIYISNEYGCGGRYNDATEQYELLGCGGSQFEYFSRKIVEAQEEDETLQIHEKVIYIYDDWDDYISRVYIYNDYNQKKLLNYFERPSSGGSKINIDDYINEASTYVYTFHKQNNQYIFEGIKRLDN